MIVLSNCFKLLYFIQNVYRLAVRELTLLKYNIKLNLLCIPNNMYSPSYHTVLSRCLVCHLTDSLFFRLCCKNIFFISLNDFSVHILEAKMTSFFFLFFK